MSIVVVIEVNPGSLRSARFNPVRPRCQFVPGVVVPIPALGAMQADVNFVGGPDKLVGQARSAAGAEDDSGLPEGVVNFLLPPARMPKLHHVAARGIELVHNRVQPRFCVAVARRQLEQKAAHPVPQNIGNDAEIPNERLCAPEPFYMSDELTDLDGVNEFFLSGLAPPGPNIGSRRPRNKRTR